MSEQNLPHFTSFMLKNQPDQTSYLLNKMAQKINYGVTNIHTGGGGAGKLYPTTGQTKRINRWANIGLQLMGNVNAQQLA